jgi:hypothetical protein
MKRFVILLVTVGLAVATVQAAERPAYQAGDLQMVGEARLKVLFWSVYDSRLYTADGDYQAGERPVRLDIQYLMNIDSDDLVERTAAEWEAQQRSHERQTQWLQTLATLWPDVAETDTISLEILEDDRSVFYRNGELLGSLDDPEFGQYFLDIWLAPETTRPQLRERLLGLR